MELLEAREERDAFERNLLKKTGKVLLTLRGNYPGENKNVPAVSYMVETLRKEVLKAFSVVEERTYESKEGLLYFFLLLEEGEEAKRKAVLLEETHPLGRLADLDVRDKERIYSRRDLGFPDRSCYLCGEKAVYCVRSKKHVMEEVILYFEKQVKEYQLLENGNPPQHR
ncbi:citrate lyase holo-[acyl-carrier protein] synthase [Proteiniclasticum ruminis]|uniref:citrate lyase holo-[acyl-carrier protein] synthase n=1 Tax=Proteiniclasticum ruminis TaxID=398199 RepID=A0A1I5BUC3_9CLOT|nr:citrate lyase holo-[acyl-carrier protein] synthase [Proteiniclasticum ruminis]SFN78238.1 holo-ACP synthase [Proteiniclasticum ruminis]